MFLEQGRPRAVAVPAEVHAVEPSGCSTVAFLSGRATDFIVRIDGVFPFKGGPLGGTSERSVAGVVSMTRCGQARGAFSRLSVELRVARAAVEIVTFTGPEGPRDLTAVLPERASGPLAPLGDPGPRLGVLPLHTRVAKAERHARMNGSDATRKLPLVAARNGAGRASLLLDEGCHEVSLLADPGPRVSLDVDAELRDSETVQLIARDRSDGADAHLDFCLGGKTSTELGFIGVPPESPALLFDAHYPIPAGIPTRFGERARAGMAAAFRRRKLPQLILPPFDVAMGAAGVTLFPEQLVDGACYLASVGIAQGDVRALALSVRLGSRSSSDSSRGADGLAVAFCSEGEEEATVEVEARGGGLSWGLSVWKILTPTPAVP